MAIKHSGLWRGLTWQVLAEETHCGRCLGEVDRTLSGNHPDGPTAGCIVPLVLGGPPTRGNVQLEHRRCNSRANTW
jgi:hypothetical protein